MVLTLKPGLVLNTKYDNFFSNTIAMGMGHYWTHTAWVREVDGDRVYIQEALGSKTKKVTSTWYDIEHFRNMFKTNILKVMDFGIANDAQFQMYCDKIEGAPYDYFTILELFVTRILRLLGRNPEKFLLKNIRKNYSSEKKLDCSEAIARGIGKLTGLDVLNLSGKPKFDLVTPQDIALVHNRLKLFNIV